MADKKFNALPGFGLTVGYTLFYLSALVLIPVAGLFVRALEMSWSELWHLATTERALAAYRLTFGASALAALVNAFSARSWPGCWCATISRTTVYRCAGGFSLRAADGGGGIDARQSVCGQRLARAVSGAVGNQRRVHAAGRGDCADLRGHALRRAHPAAGAGKSGTRESRKRRRRLGPAGCGLSCK